MSLRFIWVSTTKIAPNVTATSIIPAFRQLLLNLEWKHRLAAEHEQSPANHEDKGLSHGLAMMYPGDNRRAHITEGDPCSGNLGLGLTGRPERRFAPGCAGFARPTSAATAPRPTSLANDSRSAEASLTKQVTSRVVLPDTAR